MYKQSARAVAMEYVVAMCGATDPLDLLAELEGAWMLTVIVECCDFLTFSSFRSMQRRSNRRTV